MLEQIALAVPETCSAPNAFDRLVAESTSSMAMKRLLRRIATSPASTVLLTGESGTGKSIAAKAIHLASPRADKPFMNITCSALPEALLESELFGHERGAFTDAKSMHRGLLEVADGGTVFLDEIGEMPLSLQAKLLRFLEEKAFRRVGGSTDIWVDVRIVAATNRVLERAVEQGEFREDLYYRLRVLPVIVPPLRQRTGDVPGLVSRFITEFNQKFGKNVRGVTPDALEMLMLNPWPGNIRELKNAIEQAMLLNEGDRLTREDFELLAAATPDTDPLRLPEHGIDLERLESELVRQALERTAGNQTRAGELLHLSRDQVRYRIDKYRLHDFLRKAPKKSQPDLEPSLWLRST